MSGARKIQITDNATTIDRAVLFAAEFFGTWILVLLGCMGCVASITGGPIPHEQISLTFGLAVMVAIQCFAHVSGGHINPVVTVAAAVLGNIPLIQVPIYFLGQFAGAIAGYGTLMVVTPAHHLGGGYVNTTEGLVKTLGVCSPAINPAISAFQGLAMEFLLSFILVLICGAVWDWNNRNKHDSVTIRFGLTVAVLAMAGGPYSGANMNPARSFAPALFNGDWNNHWIYWVGPLSAGLVGGFLYRYVFTKPEPERKETLEGIPLNDKA